MFSHTIFLPYLHQSQQVVGTVPTCARQYHVRYLIHKLDKRTVFAYHSRTRVYFVEFTE